MKWNGTRICFGGIITAAALLAAGCSGEAEKTQASRQDADTDSVITEQSAAVELPPLVIDPEAPELAEVFPRLASGVLARARLIELPEKTLIRTETLAFGKSDIDRELQNIPTEYHEEFRKYEFTVLEHLVAESLLEQFIELEMTAKEYDVSAMSKQEMMRQWMDAVSAEVTVSDDEIKQFYDENREMMSGAPFEEIRQQLVQFLKQEKTQKAIESNIRDLGWRIDIAVDSSWAEAQAKTARNNPVDQARDSGLPSMINFGADSCQPCQMMKPFRKAVAQDYEGSLNVVYIHVDQNQMLAARYGVQGIPHLIFFDAEGKEFESRTGFMTQEQIEDVLSRMGVGKE